MVKNVDDEKIKRVLTEPKVIANKSNAGKRSRDRLLTATPCRTRKMERC